MWIEELMRQTIQNFQAISICLIILEIVNLTKAIYDSSQTDTQIYQVAFITPVILILAYVSLKCYVNSYIIRDTASLRTFLLGMRPHYKFSRSEERRKVIGRVAYFLEHPTAHFSHNLP